jgi:hypothetical protein
MLHVPSEYVSRQSHVNIFYITNIEPTESFPRNSGYSPDVRERPPVHLFTVSTPVHEEYVSRQGHKYIYYITCVVQLPDPFNLQLESL